ncbi:hypothetical protein CEXT_514251 [Caerostris extrusa]|uniref:Uncharacterized protein n=1 Tax=Caerostris extrusa TaxID=172846 RepID=A0AAV4V152_CAEEX|nr:hypothetical protein CEXT_514251 [Caerostris extrusa]
MTFMEVRDGSISDAPVFAQASFNYLRQPSKKIEDSPHFPTAAKTNRTHTGELGDFFPFRTWRHPRGRFRRPETLEDSSNPNPRYHLAQLIEKKFILI